MKKLLAIVFICSICSACANKQTQEPKILINYQKSDSEFQSLVTKIQLDSASNDDIDKIIRILPFTSYYPKALALEETTKNKSQYFMQSQQWELCLATNRQLLSINYTSLSAHYGALVCATEQGSIDIGRHHQAVLDALIDAIWRSGKGSDIANPFYINSVNDLYAFIQLHQMVVTAQSIQYIERKPIHVVTLRKTTSEPEVTWYFDASAQVGRGLLNAIEANQK